MPPKQPLTSSGRTPPIQVRRCREARGLDGFFTSTPRGRWCIGLLFPPRPCHRSAVSLSPMSLLNVPIGPDAPEKFNAVIEIPRGSTNKYEVDAATGIIKLDRVLFSPLFYPFDYGYIAGTHYLDG